MKAEHKHCLVLSSSQRGCRENDSEELHLGGNFQLSRAPTGGVEQVAIEVVWRSRDAGICHEKVRLDEVEGEGATCEEAGRVSSRDEAFRRIDERRRTKLQALSTRVGSTRSTAEISNAVVSSGYQPSHALRNSQGARRRRLDHSGTIWVLLGSLARLWLTRTPAQSNGQLRGSTARLRATTFGPTPRATRPSQRLSVKQTALTSVLRGRTQRSQQHPSTRSEYDAHGRPATVERRPVSSDRREQEETGEAYRTSQLSLLLLRWTS